MKEKSCWEINASGELVLNQKLHFNQKIIPYIVGNIFYNEQLIPLKKKVIKRFREKVYILIFMPINLTMLPNYLFSLELMGFVEKRQLTLSNNHVIYLFEWNISSN